MCGGLLAVMLRFTACRDYESSPAHQQAGGAGAGAPESNGASSGAGRSAGGDEGAGAAGSGEDAPPRQVGGAGLGGVGAGGGGAGSELRGGAGSQGGDEGPGGAGNVLPSDFSGLALWLQASSCVGDASSRASICTDLSGHGNDATQTDSVARPKLVPEGLNGQAVLTFDGGEPSESTLAASTLVVPDSNSLHFGLDDFSAVFVGRWRNSAAPQGNPLVYSGYSVIFQKVAASFPFRGLAVFANYPSGYTNVDAFRRLAAQLAMVSDVALSSARNLNDNVYRVYSARRMAAGTMQIRIDGRADVSVQVDPTIDASAYGQPLNVGGQQGGALRGELAELVFIHQALSDDELAQLEAGLMHKYGL